ncbi:hypothetical protein DFH08DRAFT_812684 [Mycena albidolilacea]|uniref:Uncharacterized protein n=1 Tax=Mycena albidolilacea TaxID=1033008 RepID=A0AAD7ENE4_9AGAR|nr:hypothetical protein DFH08DRAFT_812684 [Mycena albidolilacea]
MSLKLPKIQLELWGPATWRKGRVEEQSSSNRHEYLRDHARVHGRSKVCIVGDSGRRTSCPEPAGGRGSFVREVTSFTPTTSSWVVWIPSCFVERGGQLEAVANCTNQSQSIDSDGDQNKLWEEEAQNLAGAGVSVTRETSEQSASGIRLPPKMDEATIKYRRDGKKKATDEGLNGRTVPWSRIARHVGNQTSLIVTAFKPVIGAPCRAVPPCGAVSCGITADSVATPRLTVTYGGAARQGAPITGLNAMHEPRQRLRKEVERKSRNQVHRRNVADTSSRDSGTREEIPRGKPQLKQIAALQKRGALSHVENSKWKLWKDLPALYGGDWSQVHGSEIQKVLGKNIREKKKVGQAMMKVIEPRQTLTPPGTL